MLLGTDVMSWSESDLLIAAVLKRKDLHSQDRLLGIKFRG